jgi:cell division protein FtsB
MPSVILILLIVVGLPMLVGLVAVLTEHQRKMAEIIHRGGANRDAVQQLTAEVAQLRAQLAQTRDLLNQELLSQDSRRSLDAEASTLVGQGR